MHWSDRVIKILEAKTGNLRDLAEIAGCDPKTFYKNQSLAGCDIRGQDLRGMDLSGCQLDRAVIDESTKIDPEFDPRIVVSEPDNYIYGELSLDLNTMMLRYIEEEGYTYHAWAHKRVFERGINLMKLGRAQFYLEIIEKNRHLQRALRVKGGRKVRVRILVSNYSESIIKNISGTNELREKFATIIMIGLLSRKIKYKDKREFSEVSINALYPPKLIRVEGSEMFKSIDGGVD